MNPPGSATPQLVFQCRSHGGPFWEPHLNGLVWNTRQTQQKRQDKVSWLPGIPVLTISRYSTHRLRPFAHRILLVTHPPPWQGELPEGSRLIPPPPIFLPSDVIDHLGVATVPVLCDPQILPCVVMSEGLSSSYSRTQGQGSQESSLFTVP